MNRVFECSARAPASRPITAIAKHAKRCEPRYIPATRKQSRRIVRAALRKLLAESLGVELFATVAIECWEWALATSPADVSEADALVERARAQPYRLSPSDRENVERRYANARRIAGLQ